ncbi:hypothetical protein MHBO_002685, partial [Bonamia ostreae]
KIEVRKIYKKWAIVTGSTDGVGKALAFELAKRDFNLLLLSRTRSKLEKTKAEIESFAKKVQVRIKVVDFSSFGESEAKDLLEFVEPFKNDIGILINNVGIAYSRPDYYHGIEKCQRDSLMAINVNSTKEMIDLFLPVMLQNETSEGQRKGAIINMSSVSSKLPGSFVSLYSASKAFIDQLTRGLYHEYKLLGIDFQAQRPCFISTNLSKLEKSFFVCSPTEYAEASMKCIGYGCDEIPYWTHKLQMMLTGLLPNYLFDALYNYGINDLRKKTANK